MRPLVVGTYPPRLCGIATFTADVVDAMAAIAEVKRPVVAAVMNRDEPQRPHAISPDIGAVIQQDDLTSYRSAAVVANTADVVLIEHEFGIFGGPDGEMVLELAEALTVPFVVSLHTVLPTPTPNQRRVLRRLCERAASVMVFTATARRILLDQGLVRAGKVRIVPHGAPAELFERRDADEAKRALGVSGRPVVSTFGLLSEGKGVEVALRAIATVRDVLPEVIYLVAGRTHPGVLRVEGERYREQLLGLVESLGIADNVRFLDRFMGLDDLAQLLAATDVFCTPYHNGDQIVSGALTFATAAGRPTVATPYRYAQDLLADGGGRLVPFNAPGPLATELIELLTNPSALAQAQRAAERTGASLSWPEVGRHTADVLWEAMQSHRLRGWTTRTEGEQKTARASRDFLPVETSTAHLRAMVDDTGILQHAQGEVPALEHGYCVDDVARLLAVADALAVSDPTWIVDVKRALAFLRAAADADGGMRNFLSWDRQWLDGPHGGDHVGRTVWAVGEVVGGSSVRGIDVAGDTLLTTLVAHLSSAAPALRTSAYAVLGLAAWGPLRPDSATRLLHDLVGQLSQGWRDDPAWPWPQDRLTYDNPRICEALIRGGVALKCDRTVETGLQGLRWLDALSTHPSGVYRFVGNLGLGVGDDIAVSGDEQPLEAVALLDAHAAARSATGDPSHVDAASKCLAWFLGENVLATPLADCSSGACRDGLGSTPSANCGAESTLAFHRAVLVHRELLGYSLPALASITA